MYEVTGKFAAITNRQIRYSTYYIWISETRGLQTNIKIVYAFQNSIHITISYTRSKVNKNTLEAWRTR